MTTQSQRDGETEARAAFDPGAALADVQTATEHFVASAARLDDAAAQAPSLLPGWTRGHVLSHVARNADGLVNLLTWARSGVETPQYASRVARDADIERGAGRSPTEHLADLRQSAAVFAAAVEAVPPDRWDVVVRWTGGTERPARSILSARLRELEIHHVDLDLDYTPAHWHTDFSERVLDSATKSMTATGNPPPLWLDAVDTERRWSLGQPEQDSPRVCGQQAALLAWLIGRSSGDGLVVEPHGTPLPVPPPWA